MKTKQLLSKVLYSVTIGAAILFATPNVHAQVKIGSNPTTIDPNNNLEVESADPAKKISINKTTGKLRIADGSQGADRVLTSDVNGEATWKPLSNLVVLARNPNTFQPTGSVFVSPIPFVSGNPSTWNATTGEFTAPADGFYQYSYSLEVLGPLGETFSIQVVPLALEDGIIRGSSSTWNNRTLNGTKYLTAGQKYSQTIFRAGAVPFDASWRVRNVTVVVFKVN
jgi:hypothetical protein